MNSNLFHVWRFLPVLVMVGVVGARSAGAVDIIVTNNADSGNGTLRQAVQSNATLGGGNRILFSSNITGTITLTTGEILIGHALTLQGPTAAGITVSGNNASRVFRLTGGSTVNLSSLTIAHGNSASFGAGIFNDFGCTLWLSNCTVAANVSGNNGGGIANNGSVTADNCTFSGNRAAFTGGGIYNYAGLVVLRHCTVVSNTAVSAEGGGLCNYSLVAGTSNYLASTIVAGNRAGGSGHADVLGVITSGGYNLIGQIDYSTPSFGVGAGVPTRGVTNGINRDLVGTVASPLNAMIGSLQNNGGPTFTHALKPASPAVDNGKSPGKTADQRGKLRPFDFASITNAGGGDASDIGAFELSPPVDINFTGATLGETAQYPPGAMGAVGPAQYFVAVEGKLRTFNKVTGLADGALDVSPNNFFASVKTPGPVYSAVVGNPHVRYDRLSQRWFLIAIDFPYSGGTGVVGVNRILIAVSQGPVITNSASFTFFFFQQDQAAPAGDLNDFADYPSLGIDKNALYIGVNILDNGVGFSGTSAFVIRKSSLLAGGPMVVTAFRGLITGGFTEGPFAPQGVDNFDTNATDGYFIGGSIAISGGLILRRISDPGGTPSISTNIIVTVPQRTDPITVPHLGNTGGDNGKLSGGDRRLAMAQIRNGRLWTAHTMSVNNTGGVTGALTRNAARWYELQNLDTTPTLAQLGTVFSPSAANDTAQKHFSFPSIMVSGQGHAAMGFSTAGSTNRINAGFTSRLVGDPAGTMNAPTDYTASTTSYNPSFDSGVSRGERRWGFYSYTSLDPEDDMTMWTIQEFCDATDSFGVRVAKLFAPLPATPITASPPSVSAGVSNVSVVITGASLAGSGFFDPGPGFAKRLAATVSGGVLVNSMTYNSPTSVTLNLSTTGASPCAKDITIINPDDQSLTGVGILTVLARPTLHVARQAAGQIRLFWNYPLGCGAGGIFRLEQSQDLVTWGPVSGTITNPTPGNFEIFLAASPDTHQFYRLIVTGQ